MSDFMKDIAEETTSKATHLVIQEIIMFNQLRLDLINNHFDNIIANLLSRTIYNTHVQKCKILEFFGIASTAFGIANSIAISHINAQLSKEMHCTDMLVDVTQLHENHLHNIDLQLQNVNSLLTDMLHFHPSMVQTFLSAMTCELHDVFSKVEQTVAAAQLHRLTPLLLKHDVLLAIKTYIDTTATKHKYISFIAHITDLYQIKASFVF